MHQLGLRLFEAKVWKLLIIESFFQAKLNKIQIENYIEVWGRVLGVVEKPLASPHLIEFISQLSELKVWKILILE